MINSVSTLPFPLVFVHVPKTAGTSFRLSIDNLVDKNLVCRDYGLNSIHTTNFVKDTCYPSPTEQFRIQFENKKCLILVGHYPAKKYLPWFDKSQFVSFVRNPIERVISEYNHHKRRHGLNISFSEFIHLKNQREKQNKLLSGIKLHEYGFIGITEYYEESIQLFNRTFGVNLAVEKFNVADKEGYYLPNEQEMDMLLQLNKDDLNFYDDAVNEFNRRYNENNIKNPQIKAALNIKNNVVSGWAVGQNNTESPANIKIKVDDKIIANLYACKYRPDIKKKNIKRSGVAGYSFKLSDQPIDKIELLDSNNQVITAIEISNQNHHIAQKTANINNKAIANSNTPLTEIEKLFHLTNLDEVVKKSAIPLSGEHLSYYEYFPASRQKVEPFIWLGNQTKERFQRLTSDIPPANLYEFHDVYLAGHGCIIDQQNRLFLSPSLLMSEFLLNIGYGQFITGNNRKIYEIKDIPCVPLLPPNIGCYGHWLVNILPRVVFAQKLNRKLKYIATTSIPAYARKLLYLLGINEEDIITYNPVCETVLMKRCYYPGHLWQNGAFSPLAAEFSERLMPYRLPCKNRKLFISRGNYNSVQSIVNSVELQNLVTYYGFEIVEPHKLSIEDQIKLFSEAGFVMGEYGSAIHSTFYSYPGTKVVVLQSDAPLSFVQANIGALLKQPTGFIFGQHLKTNTQSNRGDIQKLRSFHAPLELVEQAIKLMGC